MPIFLSGSHAAEQGGRADWALDCMPFSSFGMTRMIHAAQVGAAHPDVIQRGCLHVKISQISFKKMLFSNTSFFGGLPPCELNKNVT